MLLPQLAKQSDLTDLKPYIDDPNWVFEQKLDGHRLLLRSPGMDMAPTALTRNGSLYSRKLPKEIMDFRFPEGEWALDGELVATVVNGHTVSSTFYIFDLPLSPLDKIMPAIPLASRRAALKTMLANIQHPFKLVPQARTKDEKIALAAASLQHNFEGLILKDVKSPYRSGGRTPEWLKVKYVATADVVVTDVRSDGKDSVGYAVYDNGTLKPIGRASLIGKEKKGAISVGDVLEVRYLYVGADGRLYQPTIMRKRDPNEKRADECKADQLKHVNKRVLETL